MSRRVDSAYREGYDHGSDPSCRAPNPCVRPHAERYAYDAGWTEGRRYLDNLADYIAKRIAERAS